MKQTKDKLIEIAQKVMKDIDWTYDVKKGIRPHFTSQEEQYETYKKFEGFEENKHKIFAYWNLILDFPEDDGWQGRNMMWILINDETGEPYEIGHRQWKGRVVKNANGKYKKVDY